MSDQSKHPALKPGTEEVRFQLNGHEVVGYKGESIINVAAREDVYIPHYCWHPALSVAGNCRLCLVEVHLPGRDGKITPLPKPAIACQTPISPGMHVFTESELARECQNGMMEFLLVNHPLDCPICDRGGECMLQRYSMDYGSGHTRMADKKRKFKKPQFDPLIDIERNRCIMCTRCVRFCDEVADEHVMGVFDRGEGNYIGTFGRGPVANILSGNVIDLCPVGCLTSKPFRFRARVWELLQTQSTGIWDASGAKVTYWTRNGKLYRTTPPSRKYHDEYTVNEDTEEFIDNITRFGSDFPLHEKRWDESRIRIGGSLLPAAFTEAVRQAATGLSKVKVSHGADAIAVLVSPRATMEEGYLAAKLARTVIGTANVDWRMSFQTAEAADAAALAFRHANGEFPDGFDALVLVNGDYLHQVPVLASRLHEHARLYNKPVVMIGHHHDEYFSKHSSLRFHCQPGDTAAALGHLAKAVAGDGAAVREAARLFSVDAERVEALVQTLKGATGNALIVQSLEDLNGTLLPEEVPATLLLRQALGDAWGYMPVLRDRNAFGLHAVGAQPDRLPAEESVLRRVWRLDAQTALPVAEDFSARRLVDEIEAGRIKAVLCLGADTLQTYPNRERLLAALGKLEFFVLSDLFDSEYADKAHVFLAAASHLEKDGTLCDAQGNLARLADTEGPVGGARPDWEALTGLATLMGATSFEYECVEDVFREMMSLIAPDFQGTFDGLMLRGPRNDFSVADPGGARTRGPEHNPGDFRIDGAHFRWTSEPVPARDFAAKSTESRVPSPESREFRITWGEHVQGDDYHLNHASIAHLLKRKAYVEIHPADADHLDIRDRLSAHAGRLEMNGDVWDVEILVRTGPAPGTLYVPAGLGGPDFAGLTEPAVARLELVAADQPAAAHGG